MSSKSRAKSCNNCRVAKTRCSTSTAPCLRCAKRRLECQYASALPYHPKSRWSEGLRPIRPVAIAASTVKEHQSGDDLHWDRDKAMAEIRGSVAPAVAAEAFSSLNTDHEESPLFDIVAPTEAETSTQRSDMAICSDFIPQPFDMCGTLDLSLAVTSASQSLETSGDVPIDPYSVSPLCFSRFLNFNTPGLLMTPGLMNFPDITKAIRPHLSQRVRSLDQGSLTAKMLFSQLIDYTRMMANGKQLPPFIHPPCSLGNNYECPPDAPHHCLPETLAICTNLTQMFYSRTPGSHDFVWQQIYTHLHQMHVEYKSYDEQHLLQALQASVVYGLLCSQCTESVSTEDAAWLVSTTEMFARRLYNMCSWGLDVDHLCFSRSKWVFVESLRRIGCLLYLADLLLHIDARTPSRGECPEFVDVPLPCARELWQPISDRDWKKRYQEDVSLKKLKGRRGLTMGNLFLVRQSLIHRDNSYKAGDPDLADELAEWVERVDGLSMLLWMSFTLEDQGQAQVL